MKLKPETRRRHRQKCLLALATFTLAPDPHQPDLFSSQGCNCADCERRKAAKQAQVSVRLSKETH